MNSKEIILNRIAGAAMPPVDYPAFDFTPLRFEDRTAAFAEAVKAAGGQVVAADGNPLTELIRRYYPDAKTIASVLPEAHATINPDTVDDARKLIDIDLGVIDGTAAMFRAARSVTPARTYARPRSTSENRSTRGGRRWAKRT